MAIIHALAARYKSRYPEHDHWHFVGAGWIGYRDAQRLWDGKSTKFSTYAYDKINYAMRSAALEGIEYIRDKNHKKFVKKSHTTDIVGKTIVEYDHLERKNIMAAIALLGKKESDIITRYYYGNNTHKMIGKIHGVNEHRISQLKKEALRRLKGRLIRVGIIG